MSNFKFSTKQQTRSKRAQALVEFAIALPVLMLVLVGIFEAARMIFTYAAVTTAAREASRYASAYGIGDGGVEKYKDCTYIENWARRSAYFVNLNNIQIQYLSPQKDTNGNDIVVGGVLSESVKYSSCSTSVSVSSGDRVEVIVSALYSPMIKLIPFPTRTFTASSTRTILGIFELGVATITPGGPGPGGPTSAATATSVGTLPPTSTATATGTATVTPEFVFTLTTGPSPTITLLPSSTATFTETSTPTITPSPTATSTPVPGCGSLSASELSISGNLMFITITNPHDTITLASIHLVWNAVNGGPAGKPLIWQTTTVAGQTWTAANGSGNYTSTPSSTITIPGNNLTSTLFVAFDKPYNNAPTNATSMTLNFSTVDCASITRTR